MKRLLLSLFFLLALTLSTNAQDIDGKLCLIRTSPTDKLSDSCGTGFFIADNTIVTAYHVVCRYIESDVPLRIEYKDRIYTDVYVLADVKHQDLAIITANIEGESWLEIAESEPEVGESVEANGFSKARWENYSASGKIVSVKTVTIDSKNNEYTSIQIAASVWVDPGMSGGPLLNKEGKVIGILQSKSVKKVESYYTDLSHIQDAVGGL